MKKYWIIIFFIFLLARGFPQNLTGYEYWLNGDYPGRQEIAISPAVNHSVSDDIDVSALPEGLNRLTVRYKDENGLYSSTYTKAFIKHTLTNLTVCEYWFDYDYAGRKEIAFAPIGQHQFSEDIDVSQLSAGIHVFHIRYKGDNGLYSSTQSKTFLHVPENKQLTRFEYWFNSDFENRSGRALTPATEFQLAEDVDASGIGNGLNTISFRVKDNLGYYSSPTTMYFYKEEDVLNEVPDLTAYEYWFNNDYGNSVKSAFTPASKQDFSAVIDAADLPEGVNVFNIRFKDELGQYSVTLSEVFYRKSLTTVTSNNMVACEYWFNNDYENAVKSAFTPAGRQDFAAIIDAAGLPEGVNVFNIRFKDELGQYSTTLSEIIYKNTQPALSTNKIYAYRYRIEDENGVAQGGDPQTGFTGVTLAEPVSATVIDLDIDMSQIPGGTYYFLFEASDSLGLMSVTTTDTIVNTALPAARFNVENSQLCGNAAIQFVNESTNADTWLWDFGDGNRSTEFEPEHVYSEAGDYEVSLTATDSESGSVDTVTHIFTIYPDYETEETVEICEGDTYVFGTQNLTTSGEYTEVFESVHGCDSTVIITLTVVGCSIPPNQQVSGVTVSSGSGDCFNATNTITVAGDGTNVIVESGASAEFIAGQKIRFLPGFHAQAGSYAHGYITETGEYCMESAPAIVAAETSTKEAVIVDAVLTELSKREMVVYPNPNTGEFTMEFRNFAGETRVMLFNTVGQLVHDELTTDPEIRMSVPNAKSGMYFIKAVNNGEQFNRKLVVR